MSFYCPACGTDSSEVESDEQGKVVCERCGFVFKSPQADGAAKPGIEFRWPWFGCGRSSLERYRFRDLFYAISVGLDLRKVLPAAGGVLAGLVLFSLMSWLGMLTRSAAGGWIGLILGGMLSFCCILVGTAVSVRLVSEEMASGASCRLSVGIGFVRQRAGAVLGVPGLFAAVLLALVFVLTVLAYIVRIPYAGPLLYGLTFAVSLLAGLLGLVVCVLLDLCLFSYLPALGDGLGALEALRRLWSLLCARPGRYLLHWLMAGACTMAISYLLGWVLGAALGLVVGIGGPVGGADFSSVLLSMGPVFAGLVVVMPELADGMAAAAGGGWHFEVAGWLVLIVLSIAVSIVLGAVLVYWFAAGVVNYRLLSQDPPAKNS